MTSVSVVIPNYNGVKLLQPCLDSLLAQSRPVDEIIVVDDASSDGSAEFVRQHYPAVNVTTRSYNGGFCASANDGLRQGSGDLVALLNNDTEVDPGWIANTLAFMDANPTVGFCASKMLFFSRRDRINSAGLFLRNDGVGRDIGYGQPDGPEFARPCIVFGASGGAAVFRRAMLDDVGLFDEDLVAYAEDLDLSFRAQLRGWQCMYVPTAIVYHRGGATYQTDSPAKVYFSSRNMLVVLLKNMPGSLLRRYWPVMLAAQVYQVLYYIGRRRGWPAIRGKWAALRAMGETLAKRRAIQAGRRVSDALVAAALSPSLKHGRLDKTPQAASTR